MKNKLKLKKSLNNTLLKKKFKKNNYSVILKNEMRFKKIYNANLFTKNSLDNTFKDFIFSKINFQYPLILLFFNKTKTFCKFIQKSNNNILALSINNKIVKNLFVNKFVFSKKQLTFLNLSSFFFFS